MRYLIFILVCILLAVGQVSTLQASTKARLIDANTDAVEAQTEVMRERNDLLRQQIQVDQERNKLLERQVVLAEQEQRHRIMMQEDLVTLAEGFQEWFITKVDASQEAMLHFVVDNWEAIDDWAKSLQRSFGLFWHMLGTLIEPLPFSEGPLSAMDMIYGCLVANDTMVEEAAGRWTEWLKHMRDLKNGK